MVKVKGKVNMKHITTFLVLVAALSACADSTLQMQSSDESSANASTPMPADNTQGTADTDGDGVVDPADNCVSAFNPGQEDADRDAVGDACDNCLNTANFNQVDTDANGLGDACQSGDAPDSDGDGVADVADNCPTVSNPGQGDQDFDLVGDACD